MHTHQPAALKSAPEFLIDASGKACADGRYLGAIQNLNTCAFDGRGPFSKRRRQRKGWLYFGIFSPRFMIGLAVVDAGYAATGFIYVYDRARKQLTEEKTALAFGFEAGFAPDWRQAWNLKSGGRHWSFEYQNKGWDVRFSGKKIQLELRCEDHERGLTAVSRAPQRAFHHTYKLCAIPAQIALKLDGTDHRFSGRSSIDFSLGYPPRNTLWNWASLDGVTEDGESIGINLVAHFMNGLENAMWLQDRVQPLSQAVFHYDQNQLLSPWRITTEDGALNLLFTPEGRRCENLRLPLLRSVFSQPFGQFEGTVVRNGQTRRIEGFGVVEEHTALW